MALSRRLARVASTRRRGGHTLDAMNQMLIAFRILGRLPIVVVIALAGVVAQAEEASEREEAVTVLAMPKMDAAKGMRLFAEKGCVACHSVNGVGGQDASALDAHTMAPVMNPFDLAAKMWRMAAAMIAAQEEALGEQILFTGEELGHIIAFLHEDARQHQFTYELIPPAVRGMIDHRHGSRSVTKRTRSKVTERRLASGAPQPAKSSAVRSSSSDAAPRMMEVSTFFTERPTDPRNLRENSWRKFFAG